MNLTLKKINNYMVFDNSDINKSNIQISVQKNLINFSPILYLNYKYYVYNDYRFLPIDYIINNICPDLIDILVSVDKRKVVIKKKSKCLVS